MAAIEKIHWFDGEGLKDYRPASAGTIFKWVLFRKGGALQLAAMPHDTGLDFHVQLLGEIAVRLGWCASADVERFLRRDGNDFHEAGLEVLGGGARLRNGTIRNYSYRFGSIPDRFMRDVLLALGLN